MTGRFEGRTALITGASRGIGAVIAKTFAREGARCLLTARNAAGLEMELASVACTRQGEWIAADKWLAETAAKAKT